MAYAERGLQSDTWQRVGRRLGAEPRRAGHQLRGPRRRQPQQSRAVRRFEVAGGCGAGRRLLQGVPLLQGTMRGRCGWDDVAVLRCGG
jgi:hypothetical protein